MSKILVAIRTYNKFWETNYNLVLLKHWFPDADIKIFCNYPGVIDLDLAYVIKVPDQMEHPSSKSGAIHPMQIGSVMLESAIGKYIKEQKYSKGIYYDVVFSLNGDEWVVSDMFKSHMEDILSNRFQVVMEYLEHPNPRDRYPYVSVFMYNGKLGLFEDQDKVWNCFLSNIEWTFYRYLAQKMKDFADRCQKFNIKWLSKTLKYGYCANFGTFQHCSRCFDKRAYDEYSKYIDLTLGLPRGIVDKTKDISLGW